MPLPVRCSSLKASRNASPLLRRHDTMDSPMATMLAKKKPSHASVLVKLDDDSSNVARRQSMSTLDDEDDTASYLTAGEELVPLSPLRLSASSNSSESSESMHSASSSADDRPENDPENENDKGETNMGEVESALLQWKRKSFLRLAPASQVASTANLEDCFAALSTTTTLWANDAIFGDMEQVLRQPTIQERCQYAADRLWAEDTAFVPKQQVAMFLGKNELFHHTVRQLYLAKFDFANQRLDDAFRCLCSKVYLKAEAQEIDRILEAFAVRFHACNQASRLLYNADVVYAIVYSLMLLNTDLHIAPGHARMTKAHFCENTMSTILHNMKSEQLAYLPGGLTLWKQDMLQHLKDLYQSVKVQGILQPSTGKKSSRLLQLPRMSTFKLVAQVGAGGGDTCSLGRKDKQGGTNSIFLFVFFSFVP
ncbi:Sec7 domain-containing protein [Gongronella butleri]|nr:Sec7 domain-containing protein [Gongronella butleri]